MDGIMKFGNGLDGGFRRDWWGQNGESWRHGVGVIVDGRTPGGVMGSVGSLLLDRWGGSWILWGRVTVGPEK